MKPGSMRREILVLFYPIELQMKAHPKPMKQG